MWRTRDRTAVGKQLQKCVSKLSQPLEKATDHKFVAHTHAIVKQPGAMDHSYAGPGRRAASAPRRISGGFFDVRLKRIAAKRSVLWREAEIHRNSSPGGGAQHREIGEHRADRRIGSRLLDGSVASRISGTVGSWPMVFCKIEGGYPRGGEFNKSRVSDGPSSVGKRRIEESLTPVWFPRCASAAAGRRSARLRLVQSKARGIG